MFRFIVPAFAELSALITFARRRCGHLSGEITERMQCGRRSAATVANPSACVTVASLQSHATPQ